MDELPVFLVRRYINKSGTCFRIVVDTKEVAAPALRRDSGISVESLVGAFSAFKFHGIGPLVSVCSRECNSKKPVVSIKLARKKSWRRRDDMDGVINSDNTNSFDIFFTSTCLEYAQFVWPGAIM